MPVKAGGFGKMIFKDDANAVALIGLNGRAGATAVVAPDVHHLKGDDLALYGLGDQAEFLDVAVHAKRQIRYVRGLDKKWRAFVLV